MMDYYQRREYENELREKYGKEIADLLASPLYDDDEYTHLERLQECIDQCIPSNARSRAAEGVLMFAIESLMREAYVAGMKAADNPPKG